VSGRQVLLGAIRRNVGEIVEGIVHLDLSFKTYTHQPRSTGQVVDGFWRWRAGIGDRPYFAMLNLLDAHDPTPRGRFRSEFGGGVTEIDRYDGSIAYLDSVVGSIADRLRARGELDRTILVITSDHGELLGRHGVRGHVNSIYHSVMRIPLIIRGGSAPRGVRVSPEVTNRDLAATILDLVDSGTPRTPGLPGLTLRHAWTSGSNRHVSPVIIETTEGVNMEPGDLRLPGPIRGAVDSIWYYIRYGDGREELFRWREDTLEARNLVGTAEGRAAADRLGARMERTLGVAREP
jgi:arylsulfatase A-like enzyme